MKEAVTISSFFNPQPEIRNPKLNLPLWRDHSVEQKEKHRADDRGDKSDGFSSLVPAHFLSQEMGNNRTGNADEHRDNASTRIAARHEELCDDPDYQSNKQDPKN